MGRAQATEVTLLTSASRWSVIGMEVTTATRGEAIEIFAALPGLYEARYPNLTRNWSQTSHHPNDEQRGPQVREITRSADSLLRDLELAGIFEFDTVYRAAPPVTEPAAQDAVRRLGKIGVFAGRQMGEARSEGDAFVALGLLGGGGVVDPDALNQSVRREADANVEKLARSGADEAHLFVWIDSTMFSEEMILHLGNVPTVIPGAAAANQNGVGCDVGPRDELSIEHVPLVAGHSTDGLGGTSCPRVTDHGSSTALT